MPRNFQVSSLHKAHLCPISRFADLSATSRLLPGFDSGFTAVNMLKTIVESFFSKVEEKLFELAAENTLRDINHNLTLRTLKRNLKALSAKAIDVEDEIKNAELSGQKKRKREVDNWLEEVKELETEISRLEGEVQSERFVSRFLGGDRAAELKNRVDELVEQSTHFSEVVLEARESKGEELLTPRLVGKAFEENLERIWDLLRADNLMSIGIYGMGGVGKTTLTKHINNRLVKTSRECVFWVTLSQESSIMMVQNKIAHVIGVDLSDEYDEDKRAARLYRALSSIRKNFVLMLDDVWKNISLEKVGIPFHMVGSKLIITSRSLQVCHQIGCQQLIHVKTLDTNEAWELFSGTLGQRTTHSPQIEDIARCMAKMCGGLPLGIITLAGSMRGETAVHAWKNALEELRKSVMEHDDMEEHVFKVLKYSFDRLNPKHQDQEEPNGSYTKLQHCFLYCSLYPEDYTISKEELVRKFISEELVDKRKSREAQFDHGRTMLYRLVNVCLLENIVHSRVKMHDLVRAMALKITRGKNMVFAGWLLEEIPIEDEYWTKDVEKVSLMWNEIREISDGMSPNCPKLSTLLLQANLSLKFIADSFFSQMHSLCVFDLSGAADITTLPNSLSGLESLKALLLQGCCNLVNVPNLGKLKALKELDLSYTAIREVPGGMDELVNLKFLSMDEVNALKFLPTGLIPKFRDLQCLHLPKQIEAPIIEMESLKKLEEFKGRVKDAADFNRLIGCRPLIKYSVIIGSLGSHEGTESYHYRYNQITVNGCNYLLMEDATLLAHDAQHLKLDKCEGLSRSLFGDFPKFNNPKSLETLMIRDCEGTECILAEREEFEAHSAATLGTLETFRVDVLPTRARSVFSSLRELVVENCHKIKKLGLTGSEFPNLESINVKRCEEIEEIIEQGSVVSFPKLKGLKLSCLPKLKNAGRTMICDSIEYIHIDGCGALKKLPSYFPVVGGGESSNFAYSPPPALTGILIDKEIWESLEWEHPSHKHLLQPFLRFCR